MLKKEILTTYKAAPGTEFAVTQRGSYYNKQTIQSITGIASNRIAKVVIISDSPYEVTSQMVTTKQAYDANPHQFPAAQKGAKKTGLLVHDATNDEVWIADTTIFMGEYAPVMQVINDHTQAAAQIEAERAARVTAEQSARVGARDKETQAESQIKALFEGLVKKTFEPREFRVAMRTEIEWQNGNPVPKMTGSVDIDYYTLLRIANLIQDLQTK